MAPKWKKSDNHILPLALLAMFSLMIPVITVTNSRNQAREAAAAKMRNPGRTPTPVSVEEPVWTPSPTNAGGTVVKPTVRPTSPGMRYPN